MSRQRIIENINLTPDTYFRRPENLTEAVITVNEANGSSTYNALAVYTFPISRPDQKNLNNRIYTSELWENQIRNRRGEGAFGLMDHPAEDGSTKDAWCVWRNLRFSKDHKLILADAYLFGFWGRQVLEALEAGGRIGLSSSGWGEFMDDNTTLDPNTYELERPADFVLNPSYEVYGVQDDLAESIKREKTEIVSSDITAMNETESTLEISPKENIKEKTMDNDVKKTSPSLEERTFELNMRSMFKEAQKIENVFDRINESKSLLSYFEGHDSSLKNEIEESISSDRNLILEGYKKSVELEKQIESLKEEAEKATSLQEKVNGLNETIQSLNEKLKEAESSKEEFENACTLLDSMKEYSEKQSELIRIAKAESNSKVSAKEYKELMVFSEELEEDNKSLKKEVARLRRKLRALIEASKKNEDDDEDEEEDEDEDDEEEKDVKKSDDSKEDDSDDDEEDKEDDSDEEEDEKKDESYSVYKGLNPDVVDYYEDLEYRNPRVVKIKEEILSKHTLLEAQKTYLKLRSFVEDSDTKIYSSGHKKYVESTKKNYKPIHEGWL